MRGGFVLGTILALAVTVTYMVCGVLLSRLFFRKYSGEEPLAVQISVGLAVGLVIMMWLPALLAFVAGFNPVTQAVAFVCVLGTIGFIIWRVRFVWKAEAEGAWLWALLPVFLLCLYLLHTHVLRANASGGWESGQSTYGDMPMHLGFITSIATQGTFPPVYNLLATDTPLGYPFLGSSISAGLYQFGASLRAAYILPMVFALAAVFISAFVFFRKWLGSPQKALLAWVLFFIGGGFGFAYFFDHLRANPTALQDMMRAFYRTPTNLTGENIRWVNVIADMLIPQRATLFGWAVLFPAIYLLYRFAFDGKKAYFLPLAVLGGAMPLIHTHSLLVLCLLSAVYAVRAVITRSFSKHWLYYAMLAGALCVPQLLLFTFKQASAEGFLRLHFNWGNIDDHYLWFYIKNLGLPYLLVIPAFANARKDDRWMYGGGLLILLVSEFVAFQPNEYDNNKLLFVWHLLTCGLVAGYLLDVYGRMKGMKGRAVIAGIVIVICNLGGMMSLARETVSSYEVFNRSNIEAAAFVKEHTPTDAIFLTSDNHNNAVAALSGRRIALGSGSFLYFHGIDYSEMAVLVGALWQVPGREALCEAGIDFVYYGDYERAQYPDAGEALARALELVYENDGVKIYKVSR